MFLNLSKKKQMYIGGSIAAVVTILLVIAVSSGTINNNNNITSEDKSKAVAETAYSLSIGGEEILYVPTEEDAKAVVDGLIARYQTPGSELVSSSFDKEISYEAKDIITEKDAEKNKELMPTYVCSVDEAIAYIANGTSSPLTYTVQGGDNLWSIAAAAGISPYELQQMNPGATESLKIGQQLNLYTKQPFVSVSLVEKVTSTEKIPFTTNYTQSDSIYKGQTQIQSAGVNGSKEVVSEVTKTDGVVVATNVVSSTVISEPVVQTALQGTKKMSIQTGSGSLQCPLGNLKVASSKGYFGVNRGSRSHAGVDLKGYSGEPFSAADTGTVTFAGWGGGSYGYLIKISHGNGVETYYAHCASVSVTAGQNVSKGEIIGTVGKTGNATGYLLHFEVRVNGVAKNPLNYL